MLLLKLPGTLSVFTTKYYVLLAVLSTNHNLDLYVHTSAYYMLELLVQYDYIDWSE